MDPHQYLVNPPMCQDRLKEADYKRAVKAASPWEPVPDLTVQKILAELKDQLPRLIGVKELETEVTAALKGDCHDPWDQGLCGNVRPTYNRATGKFSFPTETGITWDLGPDMTCMSSALLLYRILCLFKCSVISNGPDGYKVVWNVILKHKATGEYLMFGEWKGAAGIWTRFHSPQDAPAKYVKDVLNLLDVLYSPRCPHPYDGTVAGSVA